MDAVVVPARAHSARNGDDLGIVQHDEFLGRIHRCLPPYGRAFPTREAVFSVGGAVASVRSAELAGVTGGTSPAEAVRAKQERAGPPHPTRSSTSTLPAVAFEYGQIVCVVSITALACSAGSRGAWNVSSTASP